jgi:hypothetical protein
MARGKQSLAELAAPEDVIETNEVTGSIPFFLIDDEYGISAGYGDYSLVIKKKASRKGKEEDGENKDKVYTYTNWVELKYVSTVEGIIETYATIKERNLNRKLIKSTNIQDIVKNKQEVKDKIYKALRVDIIDNQVKECCNLLDTSQFLKQQITEVKAVLTEYKKLIAEADHTFKEGKKIIVENMPKTKKHPIKEEQA